uniref:Caspase n=1 Tax=Anopheles epiroticus TaxID=199890 RepID=A0A240PPR3_9DIPT
MSLIPHLSARKYLVLFASAPPTRTETSNVSVPVAEANLEDEDYDTSNPRRGYALIFNHVDFANCTKREGSDKDRDTIQNALEQLGFDVKVFNNLTNKELMDELEQYSKKDHSLNDCFVVVVMTHGEDGRLYAADKTYPTTDLWEPFVGDGCKTLIGKPKLFFVQACRGTKFDVGVKRSSPSPSIVTDTVDAFPVSSQRVCIIPAMADVLVMYSTYDGHYSWRNPVNGSWFIQSLCSELNQNAHRKELMQLLTSVSRRVAFYYQSNVPDNEKMDAKKQMPCIVSMLTKALYFPKKS